MKKKFSLEVFVAVDEKGTVSIGSGVTTPGNLSFTELSLVLSELDMVKTQFLLDYRKARKDLGVDVK